MKKSFSAWIVIISAVFGAIAIAITQNKILPCIDVIQRDFMVSMTAAGWLSSVFSVMGILIAFPAVLLEKRLGAKKTCLFSIGCCIVGSIVGLNAENFLIILISRVIEGAGAGLISIAIPSLIAMWFPYEKRGVPTGLWTSWQYVGQAVAFSLGAVISRKTGWKGVWIFGLIIASVCFILNGLFVRDPEDVDNHALVEEEDTLDNRVSVFSAFTNKSAWMISAATGCFCFSSFGFITWAVPCWMNRLGVNEILANQYISLFAVISLPMVLFAGWLLDRIERRKFCVICFIIFSFVVASAFMLPDAKWIIGFIIIYPFFESAVITSLWTIVSDVGRNKADTNSAIALLTFMNNVGMLIGPPVVGKYISILGWFAGGVSVMLVSIVGAGCVLFINIGKS